MREYNKGRLAGMALMTIVFLIAMLWFISTYKYPTCPEGMVLDVRSNICVIGVYPR